MVDHGNICSMGSVIDYEIKMREESSREHNRSGNRNFDVNDVRAVVSKGFRDQSLQLSRISNELQEIKIMLKKSNIASFSELDSFSCPAKKYDLDLPMKSIQEFMIFDAKLLHDDNFRDDMIASMWRIASICVPMQQTVRDIFKKFISRDIVMQFTAVKNTGKKQVLCKTKFYSCVQDVVVAKYANDEKTGSVSTKDFEQAVSRTINNAKDWDGNRAMRQKNTV